MKIVAGSFVECGPILEREVVWGIVLRHPTRNGHCQVKIIFPINLCERVEKVPLKQIKIVFDEKHEISKGLKALLEKIRKMRWKINGPSDKDSEKKQNSLANIFAKRSYKPMF